MYDFNDKFEAINFNAPQNANKCVKKEKVLTNIALEKHTAKEKAFKHLKERARLDNITLSRPAAQHFWADKESLERSTLRIRCCHDSTTGMGYEPKRQRLLLV